jgi:hypothetical protein
LLASCIRVFSTTSPVDICERVRYLHVTLEQAANDVVMKSLWRSMGMAE